MQRRNIFSAALIFAAVLWIASAVPAWTEESPGKTGSPYFFVNSDDPAADRLPLKSTSVDVTVSGVIADVTVTQVYKNEGKNPLEAVYVFPASTRAAVYGMKMRVGERTIVAQIKEKAAARQAYEQAKAQGKSASLLEQHRPNVFQMNVANILPSDKILVELKYTELLVPTDAVYEFVYPTVVGPRYVGQGKESSSRSENWASNPYLHEGEAPSNTLDITTTIHAGLPIQSVLCNTHKTSVNFKGKNDVTVTLDRSERHGGNRDYILRYTLSGGKIETGLLLCEGEKENFFLMMMQPPKRVKTEEMPPREYIFIVDVSGSMHGFPLDISKKLMKDLAGGLRPCDRFNVMFFAGGRSVMAERSVPATAANVQKALRMIDQQRGGGGTRLLPALREALAMPGTEGYSRNFIIATDGYVTVEEKTFNLIRKNLGEANMYAFGIGSSVNRHIIEGMARAGAGEPYVVTRPDSAKTTADKFRKLIQTPVLTNIDLDFGSFQVYDVEPPSIPDVMAQRPVIVFGKYRGKTGEEIRLTGTTGNKTLTAVINTADVQPSRENSALRYLWARHRIAVLSDYNRLSPDDERIEEVTSLGLSYSLLTAYTSFVAVDQLQRLKDGRPVTVKQPLPLPRGVSDYAVGGRRAGLSSKTVECAPAVSKYQSVKREESGQKIFQFNPTESEPAREVTEGICQVTGDKDAVGVNVEIDQVVADKRISRNSANRFFRRYLGLVRECCRIASATGDLLPEKLKMVFTVDAAGRLVKVSSDGRNRETAALEKCIAEKMKQLTFPAPGNSGTAEIKLILVIPS